jgi:glutathione peroxidase
VAAPSFANVIPEIYQFQMDDLAGHPHSMGEFQGRVLLIVNTASLCGFTPQYKGLQELYDRFESRGFSVLAFPSNQFGNQEPGTAEQIQDLCTARFQVKFPVFSKIDVKGSTAHPLFKYLSETKPGLFGTTHVKWNFTKFLVDRHGKVVQRFPPHMKPASLAAPIERLL